VINLLTVVINLLTVVINLLTVVINLLTVVINLLTVKIPFDEDKYVRDVYENVELPFYRGNATTGPAEPTGCPYSAVKEVERTLPPIPHEFVRTEKERDKYFLRLWLEAP
uniref:Ion_trans domain-containing protein n=1 Tax=Macrostomum lignano TaxID=282301 RepID=A0A1I8JF07_9PLAT